jgi:hypothetical protein
MQSVGGIVVRKYRGDKPVLRWHELGTKGGYVYREIVEFIVIQTNTCLSGLS